MNDIKNEEKYKIWIPYLAVLWYNDHNLKHQPAGKPAGRDLFWEVRYEVPVLWLQ